MQISRKLTSGRSWNTAELDKDPVAKPRSNLMTVFFLLGSLSNGQNIPPTNPDKLIIPTEVKPPIQAKNRVGKLKVHTYCKKI